MSGQIPGSYITCDLGVGCNEHGVCYAAAQGQPDQCGVTIMDGLNLAGIAPLTEEEADAYFNQPTVHEKYVAAMKELSQTQEYLHADIAKYVLYMKSRIRTLEDTVHGLEMRRDGY